MVCNTTRLKTETDPVSETLCFLFVEIRTMDKVQKLNSNECSILYVAFRSVNTNSRVSGLRLRSKYTGPGVQGVKNETL
jgi:hypothetical protein